MWKWHDVSLGGEVTESCFSLFYYESLVTCFPVSSKGFGLSAVCCSFYSGIGLLNLVCKSNLHEIVFNLGGSFAILRHIFATPSGKNIVMSSLWVCCVCVEGLRGVQENETKIQFGFYRSFFSFTVTLKGLKVQVTFTTTSSRYVHFQRLPLWSDNPWHWLSS